MRRPRAGAQLTFCNIHTSLGDAISRKDLVRLASSPSRTIVRITGGAGYMSKSEGCNVAELLADGLGGSQCTASVIAGATMVVDRPKKSSCTDCNEARMYCRKHSGKIVRHPSVMDVLPQLASLKAPARTVGVVPTVDPPRLWGGYVVVSDKPDAPQYTVVDETVPACVVVQFNADRPTLTWDDEWKVCLEYLQLLRNEGEHRSLHLVYNGGATTRREVMHIAKLLDRANPWHVLLIEDSGREATLLANDLEWRNAHPSVVSCTKAELQTYIRQMGFGPQR